VVKVSDNYYIYPITIALRKSLSVFLLLVLLFNMVGYRAWFYYAEKQADATLEATLDNNQYNENDLITLSIPLNNPYLLEESGFQRINGEVNVDGKNYKLVKRRVTDGKLVLRCIPDTRKMVLKKAKAALGNTSNDITNSAKGSSKNNTQKNFTGNDYISLNSDLQLISGTTPVQVQNAFILGRSTDPFIAASGKPPRNIA
jgi:hypothetical protein